MSSSNSHHKFATKVSLVSTALLSGLLLVAIPPTPPPHLSSGHLAESDSVAIENEVDGAAVLGIALAGSAAIGMGLSAVVERKRPSSAISSYPVRSSRPSFHCSSPAASFDQVNHSLQAKLLRLLHDDHGAARRLFSYASLKYPGKAANWYAEKIIYDLERDRGGR